MNLKRTSCTEVVRSGCVKLYRQYPPSSQNDLKRFLSIPLEVMRWLLSAFTIFGRLLQLWQLTLGVYEFALPWRVAIWLPGLKRGCRTSVIGLEGRLGLKLVKAGVPN